MNILLIGGGRQIGKYLIRNISKNSDINLTIFNRGKNNKIYNPHKFIIGDRYKDIYNLKNNFFDCIIDSCAYDPKLDKEIFKFLSQITNKFILISSSYVDIHNLEKQCQFREDINKEYQDIIISYSKKKLELEILVQNIFKNFTILRSVPIVSEHDHTNRTIKLIKFLSSIKKINDVPDITIQINTANNFVKLILDSINNNDNKIIKSSGSMINLKTIFKTLNLQNINYSLKNNFKLPFCEFQSFFEGDSVSKNELLNTLNLVYLDFKKNYEK